MAGALAMGAHRFSEAEDFLKQASVAAKDANLPRMTADSQLRLSNPYESEGQIEKAAVAIDAANTDQERAEEPFHLPEYIAKKVKFKQQQGISRPPTSCTARR